MGEGAGPVTMPHFYLKRNLNPDMHPDEGLDPDLVILYLQVVVKFIIIIIVLDGLVIHNQ